MHRKQYPGNDPARRTAGWVAVIALHLFIAWALVTGTARKALEIVKKPMEAAVIQEVIIPPPPPPPPPPPKEIVKAPPKVEAPPPPFVPPAEVTPPPSNAPAIASVQTPPTAPAVIAPPAPPAPPAPAPVGPTRQEMGVACPTQVKPEMPRRAIQQRTEGVVRAQALIRNGKVVEVTILSGPQVFHSTVRDAMLQYQCVSGAEVLATQEFAFRVE
ncbi:MAG: energy transducer TonB [Burkholderiales bacterium]|nr:energy transducer TonB [Burkholderiales bacterium]